MVFLEARTRGVFSKLKKIGVILKKNKPEAIHILKELGEWLRGKGVECIAEEEMAQGVGWPCVPTERMISEAEMLVVLGGDGTILAAARMIQGQQIPILGVNLGGMGFLTAITLEELYPTLELILRGDYQVSERMLLRVTLFQEGGEREFTVLNDAVINKGALARIIAIETEINGEYLTTFRADGLIISTPTGYTAYSLAAGGPIVHPSLHSLVITPISPHTLTNRPLIVPQKAVITATLLSEREEVFLTLDGQVGLPMKAGDKVVVQRAEKDALLIKSPFRSYFELLRQKLMWGGDLIRKPKGGDIGIAGRASH